MSLPSVYLPAPPVLLITDRKQACRPLELVVAGALRGGCRWISLREKDLPAEDQAALALRLFRLAAPLGARVMLHGDPRIAARRASSASICRRAAMCERPVRRLARELG